jgi:hypothetical protein
MRYLKFAIYIQAGSRSGSPVMTEACQTTSQKRKLQPDDPDDTGDDEVKGKSYASKLAFSQELSNSLSYKHTYRGFYEVLLCIEAYGENYITH